MLKIDPDTKQILVSKAESLKLQNEFEDMFCIVDSGRRGKCYSLEWVAKHFPAISELYRISCL